MTITRRELVRASLLGIGAYILQPFRDASAWLERPLQPEVNPAGATNVTLQPRLEAICHQTITEKALSKLKANSPELAEYAHKIIQGSIDEDLIQVVNTNELDAGVRSLKHFLNPFAPKGKRGFYFFGVLQEDAYTHAEKLWNRAIERYKSGDKENVYHDLGRVAHLLEDCAQPEHTKRIDHFIKKVENGSIAFAHVGSPLEKWAASHSLENLLLFSSASDVKAEETLRDLFYGMATESRNFEVAQYRVESDERNGRYATEEAAESIDDKTAVMVTSYLVPRVVKRVEKLLEVFGKTVSGTANTEELDLSTPEKAIQTYFSLLNSKDSTIVDMIYFESVQKGNDQRKMLLEALRTYVEGKSHLSSIKRYVSSADCEMLIELQNMFRAKTYCVNLHGIVGVEPTRGVKGKNGRLVGVEREIVHINFKADVNEGDGIEQWNDGFYFVKIGDKWLFGDD